MCLQTFQFQIAAFDGMFMDEQLSEILTACKKYFKYSYSGGFIESVVDEGADNVQWLASFDPRQFANNSLWPVFKGVATYMANGTDSWYPYDVALNLIRSADHSRIHGDVRNNYDSEWTLLLYLSSEWKDDSYGETTWFTAGAEETNEVNIEAEIQPFHGRVAIFDGLVEHSARPPAIDYRGARYSLAVKMAATKWLAVRNLLMEQFHERSGEAANCFFPPDSPTSMKNIRKKIANILPGSGEAISLARHYWYFAAISNFKETGDMMDKIIAKLPKVDDLEHTLDVLLRSQETLMATCRQNILSRL